MYVKCIWIYTCVYKKDVDEDNKTDLITFLLFKQDVNVGFPNVTKFNVFMNCLNTEKVFSIYSERDGY